MLSPVGSFDVNIYEEAPLQTIEFNIAMPFPDKMKLKQTKRFT